MDDFLPLSSVEVDCIAGLPIHGYIRIIISISTLKLNIMGPQNQMIGFMMIFIMIQSSACYRFICQMIILFFNGLYTVVWLRCFPHLIIPLSHEIVLIKIELKFLISKGQTARCVHG